MKKKTLWVFLVVVFRLIYLHRITTKLLIATFMKALKLTGKFESDCKILRRKIKEKKRRKNE